ERQVSGQQHAVFQLLDGEVKCLKLGPPRRALASAFSIAGMLHRARLLLQPRFHDDSPIAELMNTNQLSICGRQNRTALPEQRRPPRTLAETAVVPLQGQP